MEDDLALLRQDENADNATFWAIVEKERAVSWRAQYMRGQLCCSQLRTLFSHARWTARYAGTVAAESDIEEVTHYRAVLQDISEESWPPAKWGPTMLGYTERERAKVRMMHDQHERHLLCVSELKAHFERARESIRSLRMVGA